MKYFSPRIQGKAVRLFISWSLLLALNFLNLQAFAQLTTTCDNSNFNLGNFKGWQGCYGHYASPCQMAGFLLVPNPPTYNKPLHKLIAAPGWHDGNTCNNLVNVFPGEAFVARLGDTSYSSATGKEAEMTYQVLVSNDSYLFIYRYAVVLQTGGHTAPAHQPDFQVMITNAVGQVLDSTCGYYYITAQVNGPPVNGWNLCNTVPSGDVYWKDWTTVGMDLTAYFGQTIYITFKVRPCSYDTHFGYAYISAYCGYLQLQTALCEGDTSATLTAPPGFSYLWSTGDTTQAIVVPNPVTGATYSCTLTAVNGCEVTITVNLTYTVITSNFTHGSACAGSPTQFNDSSWVNQNFVTDWKWDFGDGTPLVLGVAAPQHIFDLPGTYDVKLVSYSTEGCADSIVKQVHVDTVASVTTQPLCDTICSNQNTNLALTGSLPGTTFTWTATSDYPFITGYSNNNVPTTLLDQTLVNSGTAPDTVVYTIYPHTGDCIGPDTVYWVVVLPLPVLSNTPLVKSICDSTSTSLILTSSHDSTRFTWTCTASSGNLTGYSSNTTTPDTLIDQVIDNTGFTIDTVYYHIVPEIFGCPGDTVVFKVAVYPTPDLTNSPLSKTICDNTGTNITLTSNVAGAQFTWTCTPSGPNVTGFSNNAVPTTSLNQILDVTGNSVQTVTYHIVPHIAGCQGDTVDFVVSVNPTPILANAPSTHNQCNSTNTLLRLIPGTPGTLFTWTCTPSAPSITGYSNNAVPDDSINQVLVNSSYILQTVTYHITPIFNGCPGPPADYIVKVYPTPDLSNTPAAESQCSNLATNITLTSNVAGTLFTWTCTPSSANITGWADNATPTNLLNQVLVNTGFNVEWVTYHVAPTANGCNGPVTDFVVTVFPTPNLSNSPLSKTQCDNQNTNVALTSNVAGALFTWTCTPSSGNIIGWANNAVPSGAINQVLDNTGFNTEWVTYHVTPSAYGCNGTATDYTVTVYPTPNLSNSPLNKGICQGQSTNINLTSNVAGTLFTWTCTQISGNVTGYSANPGPPSATINQVLTLSSVVKDSVIYHITPIANGCNGPVVDYKVYVNPVPSIITNPLFDSICSGTSTNIHLLSTCAGTSFNWTAVLGTGNVTGFSNGSGDWIIQPLTNNLTTLGSVIYTITPSTSTCSGNPANYTMYVKPTPHVTNSPLNTAICNNMAFLLNLTSDVTGAAFTWTCTPSSANITGWSNNASPSTTINQTLVNSGVGPETVTYHITPVALGCNGPTVNYVVTVYLTAVVTNTPPSKNQCDNTATNITLTSNVPGANFTWTCTPSSGNITGWSNNAVPTTLLNQTLDNTGYNIEWVTYHITPAANGCSGITSDYTVTVYPTPDLTNSPLSKTQCDNLNTNILLTSNVSGTLFTWTCTPSSGNITGWANNAVPAATISQVLDNTGFNIESVTYQVTPTANGCNGTPSNYVVTVYPTPNLSNAPASKSQCDNLPTGITLTSNTAGTLFTWTCTPSSANITGWANNAVPTVTLNQTLDNTGNNIESVTYHVIPAANGCNGPVTDYTVTVYPTATVTNSPASKSQCDNQNTNILLTSNVAGTLFTWTCTPSSGSITGWSNNAVPAGAISQVLDNTGFNIEGVTYQVTPTANGCIGTPSNYVVTVNPTPNLSNVPASKSQCDNLATNITLNSNVAGTQFTWTCTPSSGNITGWANNAVPTTALNQTLDNTGFNIEWVTYQVTPAANGCNGPVTNYVVTVFPTPDLSNIPPSMQLCNNSSTNLTLTSNVAGTSFTWTCTPSSGNITGWSNNAVPTTLLNQFLINTGLNTEWVTYHLTPAANGCTGPVTDYTVTVVQTPDVLFSPPAQTICSQQISNIQVLSSVPGTTFAWTVTTSSPNLSGQAPGSGSLIAQTITNSGNTIEWVTYHVTPTAFGCPPGISQDVVLTVNPKPAVNNAVTSFQLCSAASTNIIPTSTVPGSTFSWVASGSSPNVSGFSNGAGPAIMQTLTNSGVNIEGVTYQVTPTANGCPGNATPFTVTVFPVANVIFTPNGQSFCSGLTTSISLSSGVAGTSYTWTAAGSGPSLSGYFPGSGNFIQQTLFNSGPYPETATYFVSPTANGCPGTNNNVAVTVNPFPPVSFTPCFDPVVSVNAQPIPLKGALPLGGTYSGTGVSTGVFYPAFAGPGNHVITYSYTNTWGCPGSTNSSINVVSLAPFICGNNVMDVRDNQSYLTVQIGTQCWFAANLNYGTNIASSQMQLDNCIPEKYCYGDNPANCASIGGMYQWDELMKYASNNGAQGFCPPEWHIPTEGDWTTLFNFYISNGFAGSPLKYTGYSGFNALLSGTRFNNVQWDFSNFAVMFWSSTPHASRKAWAHGMNTYNPSVSFYPSHRNNAFWTRCIKD